MNDNIELYWQAFGVLTFAETLKVAETVRDAYGCTSEFDVNYVAEWALLLNTAREIAENGSDEAA